LAINEDILLFNLVKKGNKNAFEKLFRIYYTPICRFIHRYTGSNDTSEEIAQDMFIYFWQNAPVIDIKTSLKAYLFTSARNFSLNYIKKSSIRQKYHEAAQRETQNTETIIPEEKTERFKKLLNQAVDKLPQKCREIFELSKYEGLTYEEISEFLGLSRKTVENQMGIALNKIRKWMQPYIDQILE
jgi:RNA polymerase sigma-70 factor (ECF subfamily)